MPGRYAGVESKQTEFTEFYEAARDQCLRIVLLNVGDLTLAEDLVAEGFTRAWTAWRTLRDHPAPRAWVIKTALNTHISWWRRRRRETSLDGYDVAGAADLLSALDSSVVTALRRLPVRQRQVGRHLLPGCGRAIVRHHQGAQRHVLHRGGRQPGGPAARDGTANDVSLRKVILGGTPGHRTAAVPPWHGIDPES
jgi:hypothetical protein